MTYSPRYLIEKQIVEVIEEGIRKADALRELGLSKEADEELMTSILTALILTRAYCLYSYIEKDVCISIEQTLLPLYQTFATAYRIDVDSNLIETMVKQELQKSSPGAVEESILLEYGVS